MKAGIVIGVILIALGIVGFLSGGINMTHEHKDVDIGPLQVQHKETHTYFIPPILSGILLVGGIGLVVVGAKNK